jgi:hypothetical protein
MIAKAFKKAPISDFHNEKSATILTNEVNGYTWSQVFAGCLTYKETIAVPLNMPPAMVLSVAPRFFLDDSTSVFTQ